MKLEQLRRFANAQQQTQSTQTELQRLESLKGIPFYIWDKQEHERLRVETVNNCCFNHIIGMPRKDDEEIPLLPYQHKLHELLQTHKRIWIKKSRGLGITEFMLRWLAYCCFNVYPPNSRICIVVGPRQSSAEELLDRFKGLFDNIAPGYFDRSKSTEAIINNVKVNAYPSFHSETLRGLDYVKAIMIDEGDYFPPFQQQEIRAAAEGSIGKPNSDSTIIMVSTPKNPYGLFWDIEHEKESIYHREFFDYHHGLEGEKPIYSLQQIEEAKRSPDFLREYSGAYIGQTGNLIPPINIEQAVKLGDRLGYEVDPSLPHSVGVDPASAFAIVVTQYNPKTGHIVVTHAEQYTRPINYNQTIDRVIDILQEIKRYRVYVDSANSTVVDSLKMHIGEETDPNRVKEIFNLCKEYPSVRIEDRMKIIPVPFSTEGVKMLIDLTHLMDTPNLIGIHPKFSDLLIALRTATATNYQLDKTHSVFNDLTDTARLALKFYKLKTLR